MKDYGMPFKNTAIDKMSGKFGNDEPKPRRINTLTKTYDTYRPVGTLTKTYETYPKKNEKGSESKMRVQTVKPVVVKNQLKNPAEGPLEELSIRFSSAAYKVANSIIPHTPNDYMKGVLKKDAQIVKYRNSTENKKANKVGNAIGGGLSSLAASYFQK